MAGIVQGSNPSDVGVNIDRYMEEDGTTSLQTRDMDVRGYLKDIALSCRKMVFCLEKIADCDSSDVE